jgi:uncharacterized membrane protein YfcA
LTLVQLIELVLAAAGAGAINALAGGGTLLLFPVLVAAGLPAVVANLHCTLALCPGYLGATLAQRHDLRGQGLRTRVLLPAALAGGLLGGWLLLHTGERVFLRAVPALILLACALLAWQVPLRTRLLARASARNASPEPAQGQRQVRQQADPLLVMALLPIMLAALYGGYFGAGMSVMVLAALGLLLEDTLTRLNALKQAVALAANTGAALLFAGSATVHWPLVALLALSALAGGVLGGRWAGRVSPLLLRRAVLVLGLVLAGYYFLQARHAP